MRFTPRQAITLTFIAFGVTMGSNVGAIPMLKSQSGTDAFQFGIVAAIAAAANIAGLSLGGLINRRFDHRSVLLFSLPLAFAMLLFSLSAHSVLLFGLSFAALNFSIGITDLFMNAEAAVVEHQVGKPIFASFHGAVLLAIGLSGLLGGYIAVNFGTMAAALPALPIILLAVYAVNRAIKPGLSEAEVQERAGADLPRKILMILGITLGLDVAAELTCVQWAGQMLAALKPDLAAYSGLGVAFYGICSGTTRLFGDGLRARFGDMPLVIVSFIIGTLGFVILAFSPGFAVSVLAFALVGSGLGLIFPCLFSVAAHLAPQARASALGLVSAVSGPPRILLPILLGVLAQAYGLNSIYTAAALGTLAALGFTIWLVQEIRKREQAQRNGAQVAPRPMPST